MPFSFEQFTRRGPDLIDEQRVPTRDLPWEELGLTALWVLFAALWTVFAENALDQFYDDPPDSPALRAMTALNFILTSGLLLYAVLRRSSRQRRTALAASQLSHQRFEAVARATTDAIWDWDLERNLIWWSDGVKQLFGYADEDLSPSVDWWIGRLHPDDRDGVLRGIRETANAGGTVWLGQYRFRRKDGSFADVLDRTYFVRDAGGRALRVVGGISDISERRRAEEALQASRRQLRALSARVVSAREEERGRIAREIHDELGQALTALKLNLDWLEERIGGRAGDASLNPLLERVVESGEIAEAAIASVRKVATDLRPGALDTLGLAAALQQEAERFQQRTGLGCRLEVPAESPELPDAVATGVFRIFQEALTNVARHAGATEVHVRLQVTEAEVQLEVMDNGRGIDPAALAAGRSLGLLGMRERAAMLGGEVSVGRADPGGTRVALRLPRLGSDRQFWAEV